MREKNNKSEKLDIFNFFFNFSINEIQKNKCHGNCMECGRLKVSHQKNPTTAAAHCIPGCCKPRNVWWKKKKPYANEKKNCAYDKCDVEEASVRLLNFG